MGSQDPVVSEASGDRLLTKKDVAFKLACSVRSVDRLVCLGKLARIAVLGGKRYRLSDVEAIVKGGAASSPRW